MKGQLGEIVELIGALIELAIKYWLLIVIAIVVLSALGYFQPWKQTDYQSASTIQKISQDYATKGDVQDLKNYIDAKLATIQLVNNLYYNQSTYSIQNTIIPVGSSTLWITYILFAISMIVAFTNLDGWKGVVPLLFFFAALGLILNEGHWEFLPLFLVIAAIVSYYKYVYKKNHPEHHIHHPRGAVDVEH